MASTLSGSSAAADQAPYELVVAGPAARAISPQLSESVAAAVIGLITGAMLVDPRRVGKPLRNELAGVWSARRGSFRILYRIDESSREVVVLRIDHRRLSTPVARAPGPDLSRMVPLPVGDLASRS